MIRGVFLCTLLSTGIAHTHWMVTEEGLQHKEGSFFALKHPHDLVAFIHQGIEGDRVEVMRRNLLKRKKLVDTSRTLYSDNKLLTEESFVSKKPHCQGAGKSLSVIDLQTSTVLLLENKGIRTIDHIGTRRLSSRDVRRPNCSSVPFTYSIHSYDHLEGVSNRWQLSQIPEEGLSGVIPTGSDSPTNFGHRVAKALDKNGSSWVLLNLAAFYWRMKGNAGEAIECLRRALAFSPQRHRDVGFVNLGNIFQRAKQYQDAVVVLEAAVEISPHFHVIQYTLGNVYALIGDYDNAERCYAHTVRLEPDFEPARSRLHAVRCQKDLEQSLDDQENLLEKVVQDLEAYKDEFEAFNTRHESLLRMMASDEEQEEQSNYYADFNTFDSNPFAMTYQVAASDNVTNLYESPSQSDEFYPRDVVVQPYTENIAETILVKVQKKQSSSDVEVNGFEVETGTADSKIEAFVVESSGEAVETGDLEKDSMINSEDKAESAAVEKVVNLSEKPKKKKKNKKKAKPTEIDKITDQTFPDPSPHGCNEDKVVPVCKHSFAGSDRDGPAMKAYKKMITEQSHANAQPKIEAKEESDEIEVKKDLDEIETKKDSDDTEAKKDSDETKADETEAKKDSDETKTDETEAKKDSDEIEARKDSDEHKHKGPRLVLTLDCPSCQVDVPADILERLFDFKSSKPEVANKDSVEKASLDKEEHADKAFVEDCDMKGEQLKDKGSEQTQTETNVNLKGSTDKTENGMEFSKAKPRIRLRLVKLNETDANAPKSIRIEVANAAGKFPDEDADMTEFEDTEIDDLPLPLLHSAPPPQDEFGNVGKPRVPPVQYRLFQNEKEMEIFKTLIKKGGNVEVIEEGFEKEQEVDMIDGKRVIERTSKQAITEDGTVYENRYPPRLTLNPGMNHFCKAGRGLQCVQPAENEEAEHNMRIRIEQRRYDIDNAAERQSDYGMKLGSDRQVYSMTYISAIENRRYRMPRRRSMDELRLVEEPDYSAHPQLPTPYSSQRHMNESKEMARNRRFHVQDRIERISTDTKRPKTRQFDRDTLVPLYDHLKHSYFPVPTKLGDCLEYFGHLTTFDDYPSTYLGPEARGANVSHLLTDGLSGGIMHHTPWSVPVCHDFADLPFSMYAFDHLVGVQYRDKFEFLPEPQIRSLLVGMLDPDAPIEEVGQRVLTSFKQAEEHEREKDKWVLFNIAALYFRVIGNPYHAVECLRRALHFSPPHARDVALIQLSNILRRFGHVSDAAVVMRTALEQHPLEPLSHLNMATIYAAKGLRREAEAHAGFALELQPNFNLAKRLHNATICSRLFPDDEKGIHGELQEALIRQQTAEGKEPTGRPEIKCTSNNCKPTVSPITKRFGAATTEDTTMAPFELPEYQYKDNPAMKPYLKRWEREELAAGNRSKSLPAADENSIVINPESLLVFRFDVPQSSVSTDTPKQYSPNLLVSAKPPFINPSDIWNDERPIHIVRWAACDYSPIPLNEDGTWKDEDAEARRRHPHYGKVPDHMLWPSLAECGNSNLVNVWTLISTWVSPEIKGFNLRLFLDFGQLFDMTRAWELPMCSVEIPNNPFTMDHLSAMQYRQVLHTFNYSAEVGLSEILKSISGSQNVTMEEIAVRLSLALNKNSSSWVVLNLAALYWRVNGNATRAVQCLRAALYFSPTQYKDIALSALASVFLRTGFFDDAVAVLQRANEIAPEVIINHFAMANVLAVMGYFKDANLYYESTLLHQRDFPPAKIRLKSVRCLFMNQYLSQLDNDLMSGALRLTHIETKYLDGTRPLVDPDVVEWVMNDRPLPIGKKPVCVFSKEKRYC